MLNRKVTICPEKCSISGKLTICPEKILHYVLHCNLRLGTFRNIHSIFKKIYCIVKVCSFINQRLIRHSIPLIFCFVPPPQKLDNLFHTPNLPSTPTPPHPQYTYFMTGPLCTCKIRYLKQLNSTFLIAVDCRQIWIEDAEVKDDVKMASKWRGIYKQYPCIHGHNTPFSRRL